MDFTNNYAVDVFLPSGEFVGHWSSVSEATKALDITYKGNISTCITGKRNIAQGFIWKYSPEAVEILPEEEWKPVVGFETLYAVSNKGRVASLQFHGKKSFSLMSQSVAKGYYVVKIRDWRKNYSSSLRVHRLVAEAFIPNPDNKPQIDHIDTNTQNNDVKNLKWATGIENQHNPITLKRLKKQMIKYNKSEEHKQANRERLSIPVIQYNKKGEFVAEYSSMTEAAKVLNTTVTCIKRVCDKERACHRNYLFRYK